MTYAIKNIHINRIYLDNMNPRHDPIENEPEIIAYLLANENVKQLARHIAQTGGTSPLERVGVIPHPHVKDAFIAVEGNRRFCSIKLLSDPDKADTEVNKKYFRKLASSMASRPSKMEAVVFKDRMTARPWISLRHEGEQEGVGTKSWNSSQKTRFNAQGGRVNNPNIQAVLLLDYVRQHNLLDPSQVDALSITTLTRYLSNPVFRDVLGLSDNKSLTITVPEDEFDHAITRFLLDALDPKSEVSSRTSVADRKAYADKLRINGFAPTTRGRPPKDLKPEPDEPSSSPDEPPENEPRKRNNRSPDDRPKIIPGSFSAHISDPILKRLYDELRLLNAEQFSFAATYLLRAVIERIATLFLKKNGKAYNQDLHIKLANVAEILKDQGWTDRQLKVIRTMAGDKDGRYSPDTIGHFVHGGAVPSRIDAIRLWDSLEPVIGHLLTQLE